MISDLTIHCCYETRPKMENRQDRARLPMKPNQASIDILDQWEAETATNDPAELRKRQEEFEEFKAELNATRLSAEGVNARVPFPAIS